MQILNGLGLFGEILEPPRWIPRGRLSDDMLDVSISYSRILWPWTGWLALKFSASPASAHFDGIVEGRVEVVAATVQSDGSTVRSSTSLPIRVHIIPTPARRHRLLWDQFHNIGYPAGYFPRDNLMVLRGVARLNRTGVMTATCSFRRLTMTRLTGMGTTRTRTFVACFEHSATVATTWTYSHRRSRAMTRLTMQLY